MALTPKDQKLLNRLYDEELKYSEKIARSKGHALKTQERMRATTKQILILEEKRGKLEDDQINNLDTAKDLVMAIGIAQSKQGKELSKNQKIQNSINNNIKEILKNDINLVKSSQLSHDTLKSKTAVMQKIVDAGLDINELNGIEYDIEQQIAEAIRDGKEELIEHLKLTRDTVRETKKMAGATKDVTEEAEAANQMFGSMADIANVFQEKNPIAKGLAAAVIVAKVLNSVFEAMSENTREVAGNIGAHVWKEHGAEIKQNMIFAEAWQLELSDSMGIIKKLTGEMGMTSLEASELLSHFGEISRALGVSTDEAVVLDKLFTNIGGRTREQSEDFQKQIALLAEQSGVAPDQVLSDIANSSGFFAANMRDGGLEMSRTAIKARQLGLTLDDIAGIQSTLLDFETSLRNEYELEALLGRDIELTTARDLAMKKKMPEMIDALLQSGITWNDLTGDNWYIQQQIAKTMGIELDKLQNAVVLYEEAKTIQTDISNLDPNLVAGDDTIDNWTAFHDALNRVYKLMAESFVPIFDYVISPFVRLVALLSQAKAGMFILKAAVLTLTGVMTVLAIKSVIAGIGFLWEAVGMASISTAGWGALAATALAMSAISTFGGAMKSAPAKVPKMAEGGLVSKSPGGMMANIGEGGEDELISPLSKLGGLINVDSSAVASEVGKLKTELKAQAKATHTLIMNMDKYFGPGGTVARNTGRAVVKAQESGVV